MKKVVVLSGVSGSGKSTYALKLLWNALEPGTYCKVVSADDYFTVYGEYCFDPMKLGDAHNQCFRDFMFAIINEKSEYDLVIVDNTNTTITEIAPYMLAGSAYGWETELHVLQCASLKVCAERNTHNVPLNAIIRQDRRVSACNYPSHWKCVRIEGGLYV